MDNQIKDINKILTEVEQIKQDAIHFLDMIQHLQDALHEYTKTKQSKNKHATPPY